MRDIHHGLLSLVDPLIALGLTMYVQCDAIDSKYDDDGNGKKKRRVGSE